jgi:hypothetical protein
MKKFLIVITMPLLFSAISAHAADLSGHSMSCSVNLKKTYGGVQTTTYQFIKSVRGEDLVVIFSDGVMGPGTNNSPYFIDGSRLAITLDAGHIDNDTPVYDISNLSSITRSFESCVYPGQGGGDAKAICATATERCQLK